MIIITLGISRSARVRSDVYIPQYCTGESLIGCLHELAPILDSNQYRPISKATLTDVTLVIATSILLRDVGVFYRLYQVQVIPVGCSGESLREVFLHALAN